ncbi:T9SS type A sorting domain-containing protein [Hymenobacter sp. M29]|uniref:T9SS type A sorting domain-containing protein n=1 Tax=Hymenobacter mellowenesis TaxID=3063995 RepID=A0ABT9AF56_9BACT|nr:T9SS type A sorting domain-containing protein [Hymenobacter sp. M29]MDO7847312.1 T9SS type A sorting domain-containing protein [Hymenobacter sp. M29]
MTHFYSCCRGRRPLGGRRAGPLSSLVAALGLLALLLALPTASLRAQVLARTFAAGTGHSLSIHADGTLWATGDNSYGQLGTGSTTSNSAWVQVGTATNWVQVAAGTFHSLGLRADGTLYAWGRNEYGELGNATNNGTYTANPTPTVVAGTYTQVAAGSYYSLGLRADGRLYAWGYNYYGQLGNATNNGAYTANPAPTQVPGTYTQVAASASHSLGLRADGSLWAWGWNRFGELGNAANNATYNPNPTPTQVPGTYTQVAAGDFHSLGLRADGSLYAWGWNGYGQLGNATNSGTATANPTPLLVPGTYTQVTAGSGHSLGLRVDGSLWAWGNNYYGQLGNATNNGIDTAHPTPTQVAGVYTQVAAGLNHSLGLRANGNLYTWGHNDYGQLGNGSTSGPYAGSPTPAATGTALVTRSLAMGGDFGPAVRGDGTLWAWGRNTYGQLGLPTTTARAFRPVQVGTATDWVMVAAGQSHSLALKADGSLYAWGYNQFGQLGNATNTGNNSANPTPTQVAGTYTQVAAGSWHSLGLRADGGLYAWGSNSSGELGTATNTGTNNANPTPMQVPGAYTQVAAGSSHSLGLRADGSLYAWGSNYSGQLGNGNNLTNSANPTPMQVAGTYTQVAAGYSHSLGLQADGTLYAWGRNDYGQLGNATNNGTPTPNPTPTQVAGVYTQVAAGYLHSLGLRADGSLWAWGSNGSGELGISTITFGANPMPTQEATAGTGWTTLGTGAGVFSLVRTASAQSFASAGQNGGGQLGDGTATDANRFDRVSPLTSLQPLPVRPGARSEGGLALFPNPAPRGTATLRGAAPGAPVQVFDALGRVAATTTADALGTAALAGLAPGLYVVRAGAGSLRLAVD